MIDKKSPTNFQVSDISYPTHGGNPQAIANTSGTEKAPSMESSPHYFLPYLEELR